MQIPEFNLNSNDHLSLIFFGGKLKVHIVEPILNSDGTFAVIKNGINKDKIKVKKVEKEVYIKGMELTPLPKWKTKKKGIYQTNEAVLNLIAGESNHDDD